MPPFPPEFWQGFEQFNQQQFYTCHDTLEAIWMEAEEVDKRFFQGILQVAVGLYHLSNRNWRGSVILLGEGLGRLGTYEPEYGGVDVAEFADQTRSLLQALQAAGPEQVEAFGLAVGVIAPQDIDPEPGVLEQPVQPKPVQQEQTPSDLTQQDFTQQDLAQPVWPGLPYLHRVS